MNTAKSENLQKQQNPPHLLSLLMILLCLIIFFVLGKTTNFFLMGSDIRGYYTGAVMVKNGIRSNFYDLSTQYHTQQSFTPQLKDKKYFMPFVYPSYLGLALYPLSFFTFKTAYQIFSFFNILMLILIYFFLSKSLKLKNGNETAKIYLFLMLVTFVPVWENLLQGQMSFIIVLAFLGSWYSLVSRKVFRAGLWLSLLFVRPHLLILPIIVLILKKQFKTLFGLATGTGIFLAISLYMVGLEGILQYAQLLINIPSWGDAYAIHPNQEPTWKGFLHFLNNTDKINDIYILLLAGIALAILLLFQSLKGKWNPRSERFNLLWSNIIIVTLFTSLHTNYHDLTLLLIPEVFLTVYFLRRYKIFKTQISNNLIPVFAGISFFISILAYSFFWLYRPLAAPFMGIGIILLAYLCGKTNTKNAGHEISTNK